MEHVDDADSLVIIISRMHASGSMPASWLRSSSVAWGRPRGKKRRMYRGI
jgi:hypothetical protein